MACCAIGQAVTAMAAQNYGAGKKQRTAEVAKKGIIFGILLTGLAVLVVQIFPQQIIGCFDSSPDVVRAGVLYLRIFCSFSGFAYATMYICDSFATGTGAPRLALFNSLLEAVFLRLLFCWMLDRSCGYGFTGICWGMALSTFPPAMAGLVYFRYGRWRK